MLFPALPRPQTPPRVVITGAGIITALGAGWTANAAGFRAGRTAFRPVTLFDVSGQRAQTAAEVDVPALPPCRLGARQIARLDRAGRMLLLATGEALRQAQWDPVETRPFVIGTTAGGMALGDAYFRQAQAAPLRHRGQATRVLHYQPQVQARLVLEAFGGGGVITIISNACASGGNAIGHAWELLRAGQAESALAGGYDALGELVFCGFNTLQALTLTACRPFDAQRDGLALGEGAAVLALETLDAARRRGAPILGEILGYGSVMDRHHLTQPHPEGDAALAVMERACLSARIGPEQVDYVNAHGTGTPLNDRAEALAIGRWAGRRASSLPVSSTKASVGHLLGGAGAVEAVVCLMALREQWLPPETTLVTPDPVCRFPIVRAPQDARLHTALSNSFGFGGVNAALLFRRWA